MKNEITQEQVKELFDYRDGELYWKKVIGKHSRIGEKAGTLVNKKYKYLQIRINKQSYRSHKLIFLYHHGYISKGIYHNNGNLLDDRIENLSERCPVGTEVTQEYLRDNFKYMDDGNLIRLNSRSFLRRPSEATKYKYSQIRVNNDQYLIHRLIFLYHHGYMPKEVDHINGNTSDNRIENLREATDAQNAQNRKKSKTYATNPSKYKGVSYHIANSKWVAQIKVNSKKIHLGYFINEHNAAQAYNMAARHYFGDFSRCNDISGFDFTEEYLCENFKNILHCGDKI